MVWGLAGTDIGVAGAMGLLVIFLLGGGGLVPYQHLYFYSLQGYPETVVHTVWSTRLFHPSVLGKTFLADVIIAEAKFHNTDIVRLIKRK